MNTQVQWACWQAGLGPGFQEGGEEGDGHTEVLLALDAACCSREVVVDVAMLRLAKLLLSSLQSVLVCAFVCACMSVRSPLSSPHEARGKADSSDLAPCWSPLESRKVLLSRFWVPGRRGAFFCGRR